MMMMGFIFCGFIALKAVEYLKMCFLFISRDFRRVSLTSLTRVTVRFRTLTSFSQRIRMRGLFFLRKFFVFFLQEKLMGLCGSGA